MSTLPHWRTDTPFADINDPALTEAIQQLDAHLGTTTALFDRHHVTKHDVPPVVAPAVVEDVLQHMAAMSERARTINAYIYSFVSINSRDSVAQARLSELRQRLVKLSQLGTRLTAWAGTLDVAALVSQSRIIETHRFMLEEAARRATHQMSPEAEALSAALNVSGG
ncbi:MAG: M3 family oligoendopeptidase, partial [Chloroflexi bacterium]|nr:M3 family oligoendopeptidase [Chloroflexota bacterium]